MLSSTLDAPVAQAARADRAGLAPARRLMALSGGAALAWQVLWTAQLGSGLGHEIVAVLAVLAAFFGGLALGAQVLGRTIAGSCRPGRWYAGCEAVLAVWGVALSLGLPWLTQAGAALVGAEPSALRHWAVAFVLPFLVLLPASAAMGATLPALERQLHAARSPLGALYAANTFGAVAGLLLAVFVCIPLWGVQRTAWLCAAANALCALLAWRLWDAAPPAGAAAPTPGGSVATATAERAGGAPASSVAGRRIAALLVLTGALGIGYEVLAVRVLSQVTENTVYSHALVLATYLLGTAAGAALYQRRLPALEGGQGRGQASGQVLRDRLLWALACAVLAGGLGLQWADVLATVPARWLGTGAAAALAGEALAAAVAMAPPTLVMGALFTHLCRQAQARDWPLGRALALNTAGAAAAPLLVGVWLVPAAGPRAGLALLVLGYLLLRSPARWRTPQSALLAAAACAWWLGSGPLRFVDVPDGGRVLSWRDGVMATVSVVEDGDGVARLRINNRAQEGSSAGGQVEWRLAQLPLLLHPQPQRALFLGLGTGFTAAAAAQEEALRVDAVELLPEVITAAALFARSPDAPRPVRPVHVVAADARRHVQAAGERYDVVVADLFHPARSGAGALYTVEQFAAVRARLAPDGLFCQWLALHQMEPATLRGIVAAFLQVYPEAFAVLAGNGLDTPVLGLVARPDAPRIDMAALRVRLARSAGAPRLTAARLEDAFAVAGSVIAGPAALARYAAGAAANTDDRPLVAHAAPWATYAPRTTPRQRLLALVAELQPTVRDVLAAPGTDDAARLQAYWAARRGYIAFGAGVRPVADPEAMLQQVGATLLGLLRLSPDFRPARDPLEALANALASSDPAQSRALLAALDDVRPRSGTASGAVPSVR